MRQLLSPDGSQLATDPALGPLGAYSGQFREFSDEDLRTWIDICRTMTYVALALVLPGLFLRNFVGTILVILGGVVFLGPGMAMRGMENERQTRLQRAAADVALREQVRARRDMVEDLADQLIEDERRVARTNY